MGRSQAKAALACLLGVAVRPNPLHNLQGQDRIDWKVEEVADRRGHFVEGTVILEEGMVNLLLVGSLGPVRNPVDSLGS